MKKLPKSIRKYIRKEKARIRELGLGGKEKREAILKLYENFAKNAPSREKTS